MRHGERRTLTNFKASLIGLLLAFLGALGSSWAYGLEDSWQKAGAVAIFTTLVSVGLLAIVFDLLLRRDVYQEMETLSGLNKRLNDQQLSDAGAIKSVNWKKFLDSGHSVSVFLTEPSRWIEDNALYIFEEMKKRPIELELFVPDPQAGYFGILADILDMDNVELEERVKRARKKIEKLWVEFEKGSFLKKGSSVKVKLLESMPLYSAYRCDHRSILEVSPPSGVSQIQENYFYMHSGDEGRLPLSRHIEFMRKLEAKSAFERVVE
jgi:hypothetical protein